MYTDIKKRVHLLLDPRQRGTIWQKMINSFIISLILLNTLAVILETVDYIYQPNRIFFEKFDLFSIIIFTIEYLLRIWSYDQNPVYGKGIKGRLAYVFSPASIIDLLAILPFYLPLFISFDLRFIRILRLFRLTRFFKLGRYINASKTIKKVFDAKKEELVISLLITFFLIIIASSLMYFTEHTAQPGKFSSIPETMLWSVATLTTVGYGDVFPITVLGKTLSACISILGISLFALPAGILASGFSDEFKKLKIKSYCPHCGKEI